MRYSKETYCHYHLKALDSSSCFIRYVFAANKFLLKKRKKTFAMQLRELKSEGIVLDRSTVYRLASGRYKTIYLNVLMYFALYWHKSIFELYEIGKSIINGEIEQ